MFGFEQKHDNMERENRLNSEFKKQKKKSYRQELMVIESDRLSEK